MPLYDFECGACGERFEELVSPGSTAPCPACASERVRRVFSGIASAPLPVGLRGRAARESNARRAEREARRREHFAAERKRERGQGPPGG